MSRSKRATAQGIPATESNQLAFVDRSVIILCRSITYQSIQVITSSVHVTIFKLRCNKALISYVVTKFCTILVATYVTKVTECLSYNDSV